MMTRKNLIAELLTQMKSYDEAGLVDYKSINLWLKNEIKRFGANVMTLTEKVMVVENGEVKLPENFFSLHLGVKCEPDSHQIIYGEPTHDHFWGNVIHSTTPCNSQPSNCMSSDIEFNNCTAKIYYKSPTMLRLVKGVKKEYCANDCRNFRVNSPYEVNILQDKLHLNFSTGFIYTQYYGLQVDDDGDLIIPDVQNLADYLIAYCKRRTLEDIWLNDEDTNMINKLQYFKAEEMRLFTLAMVSSKIQALGNWDKKIQKKNRQDTLKFESLFPGGIC